MKKTIASAIAAAAAATVVGCATNEDGADTAPQSSGHYADVNGLHMYYEVHGEDNGRPPLVLLHGGVSATGTSFGALLPTLAESRRVIAVEQQAHGHTADIDRPLSIDTMADDTVALLEQLGVAKADFFGYSNGAGIALNIGIEHPEVVGKLVLASGSYSADGLYPGLLDGIAQMTPDMFEGSPFLDEYRAIAPRPDEFGRLLERTKEIDGNIPVYTEDQVRGITAPTLLVAADSDIVRPEHTVQMFRLLGGGKVGDIEGMPQSQLAIVPGTSHTTLVQAADVVLPVVTDFLAEPPTVGGE